MLTYPQLQDSIISKMALLDHKQELSLQPGFQFAPVFLAPGGDGPIKDYVRPRKKKPTNVQMDTSQGPLEEEPEDPGLIGGYDEFDESNAYDEYSDVHFHDLDDDEEEAIDDPLAMAIQYLNSRVARFRNRNR